jgi:hypothetical protein
MSINTSSANPKPPANVQVVNGLRVTRLLSRTAMYAAYIAYPGTALTSRLRDLARSLFTEIDEDLFDMLEKDIFLDRLLDAKGYQILKPKTKPSPIVDVIDVKGEDGTPGYQIRNIRHYAIRSNWNHQLAKSEGVKYNAIIAELKIIFSVTCAGGLPCMKIECSDVDGQPMLFLFGYECDTIHVKRLIETNSSAEFLNEESTQESEG